MKRKTRSRPECITADGFLDPLKLPLGPILAQALLANEKQFRTACSVLGMIAGHGGREAGVYLVGLLTEYRDQPERLMTVVSALRSCPSQATVEALAGELYRVTSTNATRRYLAAVLDTLTKLPRHLWERRVLAMSQDAHFSTRWRHNFAAALSVA